jgi:UPF0755 protein
MEKKASSLPKFIINLIIITIIISLFIVYINSTKPFKPGSKDVFLIEIPMGTSSSQIANILQDKKVIKNANLFKVYLKLNKESNFQAGNYQLSPGMSVSQLVTILKTGKVAKEAKFKISIPEGTQIDQIAEKIARATGWNKEDILTKFNDNNFIDGLISKHPDLLSKDILNSQIRTPLEGYLFPSTYFYYEDPKNLEEILEPMLSKTESIMIKYKDKIEDSNYSVHQILTMASLIEEEATVKTDREKISSVFYNRLEVNMPLQTDPTVLYALGRHKSRVYYKDLKVISPYNTYVVKGLPVGPIANSGEMSIKAALFPATTDYFYFLATPDGEVMFTKTLKEHNTLKAKYIK